MLTVITRDLERGQEIAENGRLVRIGAYAHGHRERHLWMGKAALVQPDGSVEWEAEWTPNALTDEGEQSIGNVYLGGQANPSKYLMLINDSGIVETDTLASITSEATFTGYARQQIVNGLSGADWTADGLQGGDHRFSAAEKTFGPNTSGSPATISHAGLASVASGTAGLLLAYIATATTSIADAVSFKYTLRWTNQ